MSLHELMVLTSIGPNVVSYGWLLLAALKQTDSKHHVDKVGTSIPWWRLR